MDFIRGSGLAKQQDAMFEPGCIERGGDLAIGEVREVEADDFPADVVERFQGKAGHLRISSRCSAGLHP
jgi:hypothetical protein